MTPDYKKDCKKFIGKIVKVTIKLQEMKTADRDEAEQAGKVAAIKKGLSD